MSFEPGTSYKSMIIWLRNKADDIAEISPAISGSYLALAGELEGVRKSALAAHQEQTAARTAKPAEPPYDVESGNG